jgi:hypothetical protein
MKLLDLKQFERFRGRHDTKVLRHRDSHLDLWESRQNKTFQRRQEHQLWDVFGDARYVIAFIGRRQSSAKFVGVWEVLSKRKRKHHKGFEYKTRELPGFEDLEERLLVDWGDGTRSWAQWLHEKGNKRVTEIRPAKKVSFPGYYNVVLSYDQLKKVINNPDSNRDWKTMLSSVSGVYIILDTQSGKQYVGSAYGSGGIWARWGCYVRSHSGGNKLLKSLLKLHPQRYKSFQFSILRVLEPAATKDDVIEQEVRTKRKLGTRAFGLNSN